MKLKSLVLVLCSFAFVACGSNKGSDGGSNIKPAVADPGETATDVINASGQEVGVSKVTAIVVHDDANASASDDEIAALLLKYPDFGRDIATLRSVDRVVETDAGTIDVFAGDVLLFSLAQTDGVWAVSQSAGDFTPVSVAIGMSAGDEQQAAMNSLTFKFHACMTVEDPGQDQEGQDQDQGKEVVEPKEECADITAMLTLLKEEEKQEEEKQEEEKQEEEKETPDQEQEEEKVPTPGEQEKP